MCWNFKRPYLDVWVVPEACSDWIMSVVINNLHCKLQKELLTLATPTPVRPFWFSLIKWNKVDVGPSGTSSSQSVFCLELLGALHLTSNFIILMYPSIHPFSTPAELKVKGQLETLPAGQSPESLQDLIGSS